MITTVMFDLGRVLVNIDFDAFPNALGLMSVEERAPYASQIAPLARRYEVGTISTEYFIGELESIFQRRFSRAKLLDAWNEIIRDQNDAIVPIVDSVQKKFRTAVLSNTSESHWQKALAGAPVLRGIPHRFTSFEIGSAKPDHKIYEYALARLGGAPEEIVFIDDVEENIRGAERCGMKGIVFISPEQLKSELRSRALL
jgi:glucose-1-phosphatase